MKSHLITVILLLMPVAVFSQSNTDQCYTCHEAIGDKVAQLYKLDVHFGKRISCAGCHGGDATSEDMEKAMSKNAGFVGIPKGDAISETCARCHSNASIMVKQYNSILPRNQAEELASGVHGKLTATGRGRIAQCTTCHNAHGITSVKNPSSPVSPLNVSKTCATCHSSPAYMRAYNPALPVDQLEKYWTSVHGMRNTRGDTKVATCASCHGSHDIRAAKDVKSAVYPVNLPTTCGTCHANVKYMRSYRIATDQVEKFSSSVHGKALLEKHDLTAPSCNSCHGNHGATPPGVESISKVCGTCHALNADLFSSSPHKKAFDARRLPECETCHGYHEIIDATDDLLGVSSTAVCSWCHSEDQSVQGYLVAKSMRQLIDSLDHAEKFASMLVKEAEQKGMEVSEAKFKLRDVLQARFQSRTMVHAFDQEKFGEVIGEGLSVASVVADEGQRLIDEYYFRRWGLGVATLIITILALSLYLVIRRIEKSQKSAP